MLKKDYLLYCSCSFDSTYNRFAIKIIIFGKKNDDINLLTVTILLIRQLFPMIIIIVMDFGMAIIRMNDDSDGLELLSSSLFLQKLKNGMAPALG